MKLFITLITLCFVTMSYAYQGINQDNMYDSKGAVAAQSQLFIKVYSALAIAAGTLVIASVSSDDGIAVTTMTASATAQKPYCMVAEAIAAKGYGKCQIRGFTDVLLFDAATTAVAGEQVFAGSATAGYSTATASGSISAYQSPVGQFLDASSTLGAIEAILDL